MSMGAAKADKDLYYEEKGAVAPIVLIHPAGATASTWGPIADELAKVGRVIAYDRRGYARSGGEPLRSIAAHTPDGPRHPGWRQRVLTSPERVRSPMRLAEAQGTMCLRARLTPSGEPAPLA